MATFLKGIKDLSGSGVQRQTWWITSIYCIFATLWIYFSDKALVLLIPEPERLVHWSVLKGLCFVLVTSILLKYLMDAAFGALRSGYELLQAKEKELSQSQQQLMAVIHSAMDAIIVVDEASKIVMFNSAAEKMFLCPAGEAIGTSLDDWIYPGVKDWHLTSHLLTGKRSKGDPFPIEASFSALDQTHKSGGTVILRDISQRLDHEKEIKRLNRLYAAQTQINQAIARSSDRKTVCTSVCQILVDFARFRTAWIGMNQGGSTKLELVACVGDKSTLHEGDLRLKHCGPNEDSLTALAFLHSQPQIRNVPLIDPDKTGSFGSDLSSGKGASAAFPIRQKRNTCGILHVYTDEPHFFKEQEIALLSEATRDISFALDAIEMETQRRATESAMIDEKIFSSTMIESMPGILYFYDSNGVFLRWNKNFESVSGYGSEEIKHMHPVDFFASEQKELLNTRIAEVFKMGESNAEAPFRTKDGTLIPYFFTGKRVYFKGRVCLVGVGIDISKRVSAEKSLRELNETLEQKVTQRTLELKEALIRAEAADRVKSEFLATMSHELRTPLNSIIGFTGILLQGLAGPLNEEQSKQMGMVKTSARHLLDLINDVLDISKIEANQLEIKPEPFDLVESARKTVSTILPMITQKGLAVDIQYLSSTLPMVSDRRRVEQILLNLLNNAVKFTDSGKVGLAISVVEAEDPKFAHADLSSKSACISVTDTGIGIRKEDLKKLFQPFRQMDSGLQRRHEGTGLGLAICRRLAGLLNGHIFAESDYHRGSTFTVLLPLNFEPNPTQNEPNHIAD